MEEIKVLRDPIHDYIHVDLKVVWDCINAREMQRLRRVHQLGGDFRVYRTAERSWLSRLPGIYEIARHMVYETDQLQGVLNDYKKAVVTLADLFHDIGHGSLSHAFGGISIYEHEEYTVKIIMGNSEVHQVLTACDVRSLEDVTSVIQYRHVREYMNQLVSGQLDADRMDYLLRDAYSTEAGYGKFDLG